MIAGLAQSRLRRSLMRRAARSLWLTLGSLLVDVARTFSFLPASRSGYLWKWQCPTADRTNRQRTRTAHARTHARIAGMRSFCDSQEATSSSGRPGESHVESLQVFENLLRRAQNVHTFSDNAYSGLANSPRVCTSREACVERMYSSLGVSLGSEIHLASCCANNARIILDATCN